MNPYYDKIMAQSGLAAFKELICRWETIAESVDGRPSELPIMLPDIFLISDTGTGRTHLLRLLADYLSYDERLMDFYGDVKYFEFRLNYCSPSQDFTEIRRLVTEIGGAAGFRNEYRGIVYIDIDEWIDHSEEKYFLDFMAYIADNSDNWLVVFSVADDGRGGPDRMESLISAFLRLERLVIEKPTVAELMLYLSRNLQEYGFYLDASGRDLLYATVEALTQTERFDGYKTVKRLCQDVVYDVFSRGKRDMLSLTAEDLRDFASDGSYVRRMAKKIEKAARVGF